MQNANSAEIVALPAANTATRQRGRPWVKGQSGNPQGMKPGTKHRATVAAEILIEQDRDKIIEKVKHLGLEKENPFLLRELFRTLVAPKRSRSFNLPSFPEIKCSSDLLHVVAEINRALREGEIGPEELDVLQKYIASVGTAFSAIDQQETKQRLEAIEAALKQKTS